MGYIVELENITKKYGNIIAVDDISFKVNEGEFFSLLGPSGCGKTTTLRIIGGFIDQDNGSVKICNNLMKNIPPNKRDTSMVFQDLALFPHLNVKENIVYGLKKRNVSKNIIEKKFLKIINLVSLKNYEKRKINELSGGQKQRVALARSLIVSPKILLLDEPLASLDKKLRIAMRAELKQIQRKTGSTFLYVTHDQSEALTMSDTIAVMDKGKIIQIGSPNDIYNCPANMFTADFIGAGNFIKIEKIINNGNRSILYTERKGKIIYKDKNKIQKEDKNLHFFIRPEKIKISDKPEIRGRNCFKGDIRNITFEGPDIRITIFTPEIGEITLEIKNDNNITHFKENSKISYSWGYHDGVILHY